MKCSQRKVVDYYLTDITEMEWGVIYRSLNKMAATSSHEGDKELSARLANQMSAFEVRIR